MIDAGTANQGGTLPCFTREDLLSTASCLRLYHSLWGIGVRGRHSDAAQERFFALVAHALRVGNDPPRLLHYLLKRQRWDDITLDDLKAAQARLHAYRVGELAFEQHRTQAAATARAWQQELAQRVEQARREIEACVVCATWWELAGKVPAVCPICGRGGGVDDERSPA
jgi:hypothetical protein